MAPVTRNLVRTLRDEPILLVLDNFETNLKPQAEPGTATEPLWACQDPAWDYCLTQLAAELVSTPSRVLITCRRLLAALAGTVGHQVRLGPLLAGEAALYLREHTGLSHMVFSGDTAERALAMRLLHASRFHPLLMDRLARGWPRVGRRCGRSSCKRSTRWRHATTTPSFPPCSPRAWGMRRSWPT